MSEGPFAPRLHRLHPAAILIGIIGVVRSWIFPIVFLVFVSRGNEQDTVQWYVWLSVIVAGWTVTATVLNFAVFRFGIVGDRLVIRSGLLFRQNRTIPLERIQNIDLKQDVLHRLFQVTDVRIETAGGSGQTEAHIPSLGLLDAERFREDLLKRRGGAFTPLSEAREQEHVLRQSSLPELFLAGATANRVGVIMAGLLGLLEFGSDFGETVSDGARGLVERWIGTGAETQVIFVASGIVLLILSGWFVSIVLTVVNFYGFTLSWVGGDLRRRHGLISRFEGTVPLRRVQVLRLERPWLRRALGFLSVEADNAGSAKEKEGNGSAVLCPLLRESEVPEFTRLVFPSLHFELIPLTSVHPVSQRRGFVRFMVLGVVLMGLLAWFLGSTAFLGLLPWIPIALLLAAYRHRVLGFAVTDEFLLARSGILNTRTWIVPKRKIQAVSIVQSPIQRYLHIANLIVATAASGTGGHVTVIDLSKDDALALLEHLSYCSAITASRRDAL